MKIEINEETVAKEIASLTNQWLYDSLSCEAYSNLWYNKAFEEAIKEEVKNLFSEHRDNIIKEIVNKASEKLATNGLLAVLLNSITKK